MCYHAHLTTANFYRNGLVEKHPSECEEAPAKLVVELRRRSGWLATPNPDIAPVVAMYNPESHVVGSFVTSTGVGIAHMTLWHSD